MKLVKTEGCICWGTTVDDENIIELPEEKIIEIFNKLPKSKEFLIQCINDYIGQYGEYEHIGDCEECGDSIDGYTYIL